MVLLTRLSGSEKTEFENWLHYSDENRSIFNKTKYVWEQSGVDVGSILPDKDKMWDAINPENKQSRKSVFRKIYSRTSTIQKIAASILILVCAGFILYKTLPILDTEVVLLHGQANEYKTEFILSDGSTVWLNQNSTLTYPEKFIGANRVVELKGEAYFEITKDKRHPFIISSEGTKIKVLGTAFNVNAPSENDKVKVTVTKGKVSFYESLNEKNKVLLTKGEEADFNKNTHTIEKRETSDLNFLAWKTGCLSFNNSSLSEVCKTLSKHYKIEINIADDALISKNLTAKFDNKTIKEVIQILELTLDIEFIETNSAWLLKNKAQ